MERLFARRLFRPVLLSQSRYGAIATDALFRSVAKEALMDSRIFAEERRPLRVPAIPSFVVAAHVSTGCSADALRIGWLGEHFRKHLETLQEGPSNEEDLFWNRLLVEAYDEQRELRRGLVPGIVPTLGGAERTVVTFGQFWFGLTRLSKAERELSYVAYVLDVEGKTVGVMARWVPIGLYIESGPYNRPYSWGAGAMFLSR